MALFDTVLRLFICRPSCAIFMLLCIEYHDLDIWVYSRSLKLLCYHSKDWIYRFLFAFHSNYGSVLYHFRDKTRYWSKIWRCFITLNSKFDETVRAPSEYCHTVWCVKNKMVWLPDGEKKFKRYV